MASQGNTYEQFGLVVKVPVEPAAAAFHEDYPRYPSRHSDDAPAGYSNYNETPSRRHDDITLPRYSQPLPGNITDIRPRALQSSQPRQTSMSRAHHGTYDPISKEHNQSPDVVPAPSISVEHSFQEMVSEQPSQNKRTFVVLDCANIGWAYGDDHFDVTGIRKALAFFAKYDVDVVAFIPSSYLKKKPRDGGRGNAVMETDEREQLETLVRTGDVTVVPSGDHDDVYILSYARSNNGFIVSNDFYADHIASVEVKSIQSSMKLWLNVNRCGFTFLNNSHFMINPGSVLSTVMGYLAFKERRLDFDANSSAVIDSLTLSIQILYGSKCYQQLKYVLLARSVSYMEVSVCD